MDERGIGYRKASLLTSIILLHRMSGIGRPSFHVLFVLVGEKETVLAF